MKKQFPLIEATPKTNCDAVVSHCCKQLDAIVKDGTCLLSMLADFKRDNKDLEAILRVIEDACNYDIKRFVSHAAIQSVLTAHGMTSMKKDWKYVLFSPFIYALYPIIYLFNSSLMKQLTVNQLLPVCALFFMLPVLISKIFLNQTNNLEYESYDRISFCVIVIWWISFALQEIQELMHLVEIFVFIKLNFSCLLPKFSCLKNL